MVDIVSAVEAIADAAQGSITISQPRTIDSITVDCTIEETGTDELVITEHPVEQGAAITDHAYKKPSRLVMRVGWWNGSANSTGETYAEDTYNQLLALQLTRQPFEVMTGMRLYEDMLIASMSKTTDAKTAAILMLTVTFQQVILVQTTTTQVPPMANQANPQGTAPVVNGGTAQPQPVSPPQTGG